MFVPDELGPLLVADEEGVLKIRMGLLEGVEGVSADVAWCRRLAPPEHVQCLCFGSLTSYAGPTKLVGFEGVRVGIVKRRVDSQEDLRCHGTEG